MAKLKYLVLHCAETPEGQYFDQVDVFYWHVTGPKPPNRGWRKPGYTDLILLDGTIQNMTPFDQDDQITWDELSYGARGYNAVSRHVCYIGGLVANAHQFKRTDPRRYKDTRTKEQLRVMGNYVRYMIDRHPHIKVVGHRQLDPHKVCPCFDVPTWAESIGLSEKNIYRS